MKKKLEELRNRYSQRPTYKQVIKKVFFGGRWIKYYGLQKIK